MVRKRAVNDYFELNIMLKDIIDELDRIKFGNISHNLEVADTGAADTAFTVTHNLRQTPEGWVMKYQNKAGSLYLVSWTDSNATFKFSGANANIKFRLF